MDILSPQQSKQSEWPNSPAARGKYYGCPDPVWKPNQIVVMSDETWLDFGTLMAKQREILAKQDNTITNQRAVIAQLTAQLTDVQSRLEATRAARKKEKLSWLGLGPRTKTND